MIIPCELNYFDKIPSGFRCLGETVDSWSENGNTYSLYKHDGLLVIHRRRSHRFRAEEILQDQICIPWSAIDWLLKAISNFYTPPSQGGQPAGKISMDVEIDGEHLLLHRMASIDGKGYAGFSLSNRSRDIYGYEPGSEFRQECCFTDDFLRNSNFLGLLASIADK